MLHSDILLKSISTRQEVKRWRGPVKPFEILASCKGLYSIEVNTHQAIRIVYNTILANL